MGVLNAGHTVYVFGRTAGMEQAAALYSALHGCDMPPRY